MAKREEAVQAAAEGNSLVEEAAFSKEQLLQAEVFKEVHDLLDALLQPEERLTIAQAEERIQAFLTKEAL